MTQLYNVSFTTQTLVRKLDAKGREIGVSKLDNPVKLSALPYATAMSYQIADNFKIEPYVPDQRYASKGAGRSASVGSGTKKVVGARPGPAEAVAAGKSEGRSRIAEAAMTGNLGAALHV